MKNLLYISVFIIGSSYTFGQVNLVPNGSFENTTATPTGPYEIENAVGWTSYRATPDLFSMLSPAWSSVLLPSNQANDAGFQYPYDGNNIAMFLGYSPQSGEQREYIGTTLSNSLEIGKFYSVSMQVSLLAIDSALGYTGAIDKIGVLFTTTPYSWSNPLQPTNYAHVYSASVISDTSGWVTIQGTFEADSAYQYMAIGNFFDDANTTFTKFIPGSPYDYALYFVDSVSVMLDSINNLEENTEGQFTIKNLPNNLTIETWGNEVTTCFIYSVSGELISTESFENKVVINTSDLAEGTYFIYLNTNQNYYTQRIFIQH